ncbi:MAG: ribosome silencing factor [Gammaproteobacteria bacterium]|nr:MAG: ribosome silencing factor [Gammaproteobacteria bacterium]PIE34937.1 MAG: ribosome silencing factor [Gammaproteobacteria bacterium]
MNTEELISLVVEAIDDMKGVDLQVIDIVGKSSIADAMIVVTGTSQRHVASIAENVRDRAKQAGHAPLGVEGEGGSDWVLVDLGDAIVHVMTAEKRDFYALEKLWSVGSEKSIADDAAAVDEADGKDSVSGAGAA